MQFHGIVRLTIRVLVVIVDYVEKCTELLLRKPSNTWEMASELITRAVRIKHMLSFLFVNVFTNSLISFFL